MDVCVRVVWECVRQLDEGGTQYSKSRAGIVRVKRQVCMCACTDEMYHTYVDIMAFVSMRRIYNTYVLQESSLPHKTSMLHV